MPDYITIDDVKIGLGQHKKVNLNIARLPTHTNIDLPVHVFRAKTDGPVLLLTGGLHGDEINGIEIIRRLIKTKQNILEIKYNKNEMLNSGKITNYFPFRLSKSSKYVTGINLLTGLPNIY